MHEVRVEQLHEMLHTVTRLVTGVAVKQSNIPQNSCETAGLRTVGTRLVWPRCTNSAAFGGNRPRRLHDDLLQRP